jgi:uncharacterized protein
LFPKLRRQDFWAWFTETGRHVGFVSPTLLIMIVALGDDPAVADQALAAYVRARAPKRLVTLPSGHFDAYVAGFDVALRAASEWFVRHLMNGLGH